MWNAALDRVLRGLIVHGRLAVTYPDGTDRAYGPGDGPHAAVTLTTPAIVRRLCLSPELALGEGYMSGAVQVPGDGLYDLLALAALNRARGAVPPWVAWPLRARTWARGWLLRNTARSARANVAHHYDLSDDFYRLFLDDDMQYSCAYFARPGLTLDEAQAAKKAHIAAKLMLQPGQHVLDIGCGWGGLALTLARDYGVRVTGVTLSENQLARAQARARQAGLADRVQFHLMDYRRLTQRFDRVVSVGMLEHVGTGHFGEYFARVHDLLHPDGVALIHTIGHLSPPRVTSPWITKYIFPGGYVPTLSDLTPAVERAGLWTTDIEVLRGHYGPTCRAWRDRFEARLDQVRAMYDDRFIRMWRYYLTACEVAFEEQHQAVFQVQLARQQYAVPVTRDYLYRPEQGFAQAAQ